MDFIDTEIRLVVLHWVRCVAFLVPIPVFGASGASRAMRVAIGVLLGTSLAFVSPRDGAIDPGSGLLLMVCTAKEALFGYLLGWIVSIGFGAMRIAGDFVGTEMGFNMASIADPITGVNTQVMAHLFESIGLTLFFVTGAHLSVVRALALSFERYPVTTFDLDGDVIRAVVGFTTGIFAMGLRIAAPVVVALILVGIAMAILAKVAPQLQVMVFGFPVKILSGALVFVSSLGIMVPAMSGALQDTEEILFGLVTKGS